MTSSHTWVEARRERAVIVSHCTVCGAERHDIVAYDYSQQRSNRIPVTTNYRSAPAAKLVEIEPLCAA